ncbi:MAG: DNA primase [Bacteroidia bacterium]|nr:DNA primase [Bacteroidia bacterium]MBP7260083.1 DNA primase [Bacteroidia bacterium]MBP9179172.1 DNA primase [Bacteroidia bacterium]MBP9723619.1 DNA primase [Bacteroidia bacterium]
MIPREKVEEIINAARIEEVVGEYVTLKKRGANLLGVCPFHNEKTPSFTVSPAKGIYKCFGCGKAGDSVRFIMEHDSMSYPDALRHLANKYNITIEEIQLTDEALQSQNERESVLISIKYAADYFIQQLWDTEEGQNIGLSYFEERGFSKDTIKKFGLGYSKDGWSHFYEHAISQGYKHDFLQRAGLITTNESGKSFDLFRGRVMFPIHDLSGRVVAFGGRIMKKDPKSPKYVNSPETEVYHKSNVLYGMFFAKQDIRKYDRCYLVEGYTDVVTLNQGGIANVVASSGTSLTEGQIKLIKRFTDNVVVLYDGDQAGLKASLRGVDLILEQGLNVKVVTFPDGEDPDSYCKAVGGEEFSEYIHRNEKDFIIFKSNLLLADSANDPVKRAEVIKDIVESIAKVPDSIKRSVFIKECSKLLEIQEQVLINEMNKLLRNKRKEDKDLQQQLPEEPLNYEELLKENEIELNTSEYQERDIVRLLVQNSEEMYNEGQTVAAYVLNEIETNELKFSNEIYQHIIAACKQRMEDNEPLNQDFFINHEDQRISSLASDMLISRYELSARWDEKYLDLEEEAFKHLQKDVDSALMRFKLRHVEELLIENNEVMRNAPNEEELIAAMQVHQYLMQIRKELTEKIGTVVVK